MRDSRRLLPVLLFCAGCSLLGHHSRAGDLAARMDLYMRTASKADHFMGSVLIARHGRIILARGYGMANLALRRRNTADTAFRIGSLTKEFTATAILELESQGRLNIRDPICRYVPHCPHAWRPISIYELLTHTSGIPNFTSSPDYSQIELRPTSPSGLLALFEYRPLDFKPGTAFRYSNSGYEVLGYIIERTSGETYREFVAQNIFEPLGMADSGYDGNHPAPENHAVGYDPTPAGYQPARFVDMSVPFSAGALYSTVLDLYKWDHALHAGKLLPRRLLNQMFSPHVRTGRSDGAHYGLGWFISTDLGHKEIWHMGEIEGFTAINSWFPDDDAYVIVLDNATCPVIGDIGRSLAAILFANARQ